MRTRLKIFFLHLLKYTGMFHVSRALSRRALRILCYHGTSLDDEHLFRRTLYMRPDTFRRRMELIVRRGYNVLKLDDAVRHLDADTMPPLSVVITADDGWYGCKSGMFPVLRELTLDATLYLTTFFAERSEPVLDVFVGYLFWKTRVETLQLDGVPGLENAVALSDPDARERASDIVIEHVNERLDDVSRGRFLEELAERLDVDLEAIRARKLFHLIPLEEIDSLRASGVDVQLHTHRHRLDLEHRDAFAKEIADNRAILEPLVGRSLEHFCYPSGVYHSRVYPWLDELGIKSSTIGKSGFCYPDSPRQALPRIVDGEDVPEIEFEAELAGALELFRRARAWLG